MNRTFGGMKNRLCTVSISIALINESNCDHGSEHANSRSSAAPQLKNVVEIVSWSRPKSGFSILRPCTVLPRTVCALGRETSEAQRFVGSSENQTLCISINLNTDVR